MMVTMSKIADEVGVSRATVSFVLNERDGALRISEDTRRRVQETAREMGYQPNRAAQALASGRTHLISLWMRMHYSDFHNQMIPLVAEQLRATDYDMIVSTIESDTELHPVGASLLQGNVDGVLALDAAVPIRELRRDQRAACPAIVNMGGSEYLVEDVDYVGVNLRDAAGDAVRHLLKSGQRIAFLGVEAHARSGEPRFDAYHQAMAAAGCEPDVILAKNGERRAGFHAMDEYLRSGKAPEGLFCTSDELAEGAFRALRTAGLRVPQDVALVGCNGNEESEYFDPPLSTVVQPVQEMTELAWSYLQNRLNDPDTPLQQTVLPAKFVARESSPRR